jgi:hypothetical protein
MAFVKKWNLRLSQRSSIECARPGDLRSVGIWPAHLSGTTLRSGTVCATPRNEGMCRVRMA